MSEQQSTSGWREGPLPTAIYNWGAVVPIGYEFGFFFADFHGDGTVTINPGTSRASRLQSHQVAWWNNSIDIPPNSSTGRGDLEYKPS